jgi:glycosyltransferase involved in cell wall biosynthesis
MNVSREQGPSRERAPRVAMLSPVTPAHGRGGVQDIVWSLARGLAGRGSAVELVTSAHPAGLEAETIDGVRVRYLGVPARELALHGLHPRWMNASRAAVLEAHARSPLDVIHSQSYCGLHLVGALPGVPVVATLHGTHVDELKTRARVLRENLPGRPFAALRVAAQWALMAGRFVREAPRLERCTAVIATSREQRAILLGPYHVPEARLHDVWNGIDTALFAPRPADAALRARLTGTPGAPGAHVSSVAPLVLAVARLYQEKGIQHALRAWPLVLAAIPTATLAVVGDGPYQTTLESLAASLHLGDRVRFTGPVALEALPSYYAAADAFVNPTVRINGYDLTILQAMACARPVVVSNIGSVPTAVADGVDGLLAPPGDAAAIAARLLEVLRVPERAAALGAAARCTVCDRFSLDSMVEGTLAVYRAARAVARERAAGGTP